jgi:hypothetical protein
MNATGLAALLSVVVGCSSSAAPSLYSTWIYTSGDGTSGAGLTLTADNTYVSSILQLTSDASGNTQSETGTFTLTNSTIEFKPLKWSCAEPTDPPYTVSYTLSGGVLTLASTSGVTAYQVDTSAASAFQLTTGCFAQNGDFVPAPLAAVGSCSAAGTSCTSDDSCCLGNVCANLNGGTCAGVCTQDSDCQSGCCTAIGTVSCTASTIDRCGYCALAATCSPPDAG